MQTYAPLCPAIAIPKQSFKKGKKQNVSCALCFFASYIGAGSLKNFKFISDTPYGFQSPLIADTLQFLTQALYMNINRSGISQIVEAPYFIKKLIPCKYTIGI